MPKYLKTKDGSLESAVLEAVSPAQQAAIAISKKKKAGKPGYDDEGKSLKNDVEYEVPEEIEKEGVADFIGAASKAAAAGKKEFKFGDKTYPVKIKKDVAKKVASKMEEVKLQEKPADYLELEFNSSRDAAKAYDYINNKLYATGNQPFNIQPNEGNSLQFEDMDDADKVMAELKKARFKFKVYERESVQEETLAMRTAKHISDMWSEAAKKDEVKSELHDMDKDEKKKDKTMTGKPMSKVDTKVVEKD